MKVVKITLFLFLFIIACSKSKVQTTDVYKYSKSDTTKVDNYNSAAFKSRLINPDKTIRLADSALQLAKKLGYSNGIGEAYRVKGVGHSYLNRKELSIENYLNGLTYFIKSKNQEGEAKIYNNIGNLYQGIDHAKSVENYEKSLKIALDLNIKELIAGLYLNIGTVSLRQKDYQKALINYEKSLEMFTQLQNSTGIVQSLQNLGVTNFNLQRLDISENYLLKAISMAKENNLFNSIASINLTLSSIYIKSRKFEPAEKSIEEGRHYARLVKSPKLIYDFNLTSYELENERKSFEKALYYLQQVYKQDSITYKNNVSDKINLLEAQHRQMERQKENELTIAKQKYTQVLIWGVSIVAALAFVVIFLLFKNVRKSAINNKELTRLNQEISKQKDHLDKVNHNLEEIIDQRTLDLKIKNKKLSEYSSHLSHQIRSPVATLKGLILLQKDNLIDQNELTLQMGKCIHDLDDKIININENLNNPQKTGLINDD